METLGCSLMDERMWAVYKRANALQFWRLAFVMPQTFSEEEVQIVIDYTNDVLEQEHKIWWMMLLIPYSEIQREVPPQKYGG